jgi:hypothetical protein
MLSKMVCSEEFLGVVALTKFMNLDQMVNPSIAVTLESSFEVNVVAVHVRAFKLIPAVPAGIRLARSSW